jgi:hypothetical protein
MQPSSSPMIGSFWCCQAASRRISCQTEYSLTSQTCLIPALLVVLLRPQVCHTSVTSFFLATRWAALPAPRPVPPSFGKRLWRFKNARGAMNSLCRRLAEWVCVECLYDAISVVAFGHLVTLRSGSFERSGVLVGVGRKQAHNMCDCHRSAPLALSDPQSLNGWACTR